MTGSDNETHEKLASTVLRQGELKLSAQLTVALASDQRSSIFASVFAGISTAAWGVAILAFTDSNPALGVGGLFAGVVSFAATILSLIAASPRDF